MAIERAPLFGPRSSVTHDPQPQTHRVVFLSVWLPDSLRTSTFRLAATFALTFGVSAALLFAFIYWQTAIFETARIDGFLVRNADVLAQQPSDQIVDAVSTRILGDLHRISFAALFDRDGHRLAGNIDLVPPTLPIDGRAHRVDAVRNLDGLTLVETVRAVARRRPDGTLLLIGRNVDELEKLRELILRALELGVIPATLLSLAAGAFISGRARQRVKAVHLAAERIMHGNIRERLPTHGTIDDFDRLAVSLNRMLDEINRLLDSVKQAGDDIAHDLRTPLARLRSRLERARATAETHDELQSTVETAITDLDQALGLVTTLLRIGEIDAGQRRAAFRDVDIAELIDDLIESYRPVAEDKGITLTAVAAPGLRINADPGLFLEAIANLAQNAIKFVPPGGHVTITSGASPAGIYIHVADDGPGIPVEEREKVFDRFHRLDKSRNFEGNGLGLSLVASILRLHGFSIRIDDNSPGALFEITCRPTES